MAHRQPAQVSVVIVSTGAAHIAQQLHDRILCNASDAHRTPDAVSFTEAPHSLRSLRYRKLFHTDHYA
jgi:hypothetical protein